MISKRYLKIIFKIFPTIACGAVLILNIGCGFSLTKFESIESTSAPPNGALMKISLLQTEMTFTEGSAAVIQIVADQKYEADIPISLLLTGYDSRFQSVAILATIPKNTLGTTVVLQSIDDALFQGPQDYVFSISSTDASISMSPGSMTIHLLDNDSPPTVQWNVASQTVSEGVGSVTVNAELSSASAVTTVIPFSQTGSATVISDYTISNSSISIPAGSTSGSATFSIVDDAITELAETIVVTIGTPTNATLGAVTVHTITVADNENTSPVANNDAYTVTSLSPVSFSVQSNDTDANGDALVISALSVTTSGLSTVSVNGADVLYTPGTTFPGSETFTYTLDDGRGGTSTGTVTISYQIPFTWIGAGIDANWGTTANWRGGVAPSTSDNAYFNNQCTTWCNPNVNANISIKGARLDTSFSGTISQGLGNTITVGSNGWIQRGGNFTGSNAAITFESVPSLNFLGGLFTSTTGTLLLRSGSVNISNPNYFSANGGTVKFGTGSNSDGGPITITAPLGWTVSKFRSQFYSSWAVTMNTGSFMTVTSDLTFENWGNNIWTNSNITLLGDIYLTSGPVSNPGLTITMKGTGAQTIYGTGNNVGVPNLIVDKPSGTLYLDGTVAFGSNITHVSGNFDAGTTTATFGTNIYDDKHMEINTGPMHFYNVKEMNYSSYRYHKIIGTVFVDGDLTVYLGNGGGQNLEGGTLEVKKDVLFAGGDYMSSSTTMALVFSGTGNQSVLSTGGTPFRGNWTVNKASGTLTLGSSLNLSGGGINLTVAAGTLDLAGYNLFVNSNIINNGVIRLGSSGSCGSLTQGGTFTGNPTICP